ncbi:MAG: acetyltransferase [Anaerolineaceae bacterium]|nr:acetyltransferase [Anaerolineaceae bacterium]
MFPTIPSPSPDSTSLIVFGGGGHGKAVIELVRMLPAYQVIGVIDDRLPPGSSVLGTPVLGGSARLDELRAQGICSAVNAVGGIGDIQVRVSVFERLRKAGFEFPALVHPTAFVEQSAILEPGVQLFPHAYAGSDARLGFGVILNLGAAVAHDGVLGDYTNISPGAMLAGMVVIGERVLIGMNATINIGLHVGAGARIGNGATIKADVPVGAVVHAGEVWPGSKYVSA